MRKMIEVTGTIGRDKGKVYLITEMPASQAERWALRAFLALARSGVDVPEEIADSGMAGLASLGLKALASVNYDDAVILLDEMMACVEVIPDAKNKAIKRALIEDDIEEVATRLTLKKEVMKLHWDFSQGVGE